MIIDERDEGGKSKDNKRVKSKQHCSGREKTVEAGKASQRRGFEWSMWCWFICSCFLLSPKMKEIFLTQFNVHSFNFTSMMSF